MIDGLRIWYKIERLEEILSNENIDWETPVNIHTGELPLREYKGVLKNLEIKILKRQDYVLIIGGSIHKYFHGSYGSTEGKDKWVGNNSTKFTYSDLCNSLLSLSKLLGVELNKCEIKGIESGVNINTEFVPSIYYNGFILHKLKSFQDINNIVNSRRLFGVQCLHSQMAIKCYDKGQQYKLPNHLLRFEIKVFKMQFLKKLGINKLYLSDLLNKDLLEEFKDILLKTYSEILMVKEIESKGLRDKDVLLMVEGKHPTFWQRMKDEIKVLPVKERKKARSKYDTQLKRFKKIQKEYGILDTKHEMLKRSMEQVFNNLLYEGHSIEIDVNLPTPEMQVLNMGLT